MLWVKMIVKQLLRKSYRFGTKKVMKKLSNEFYKKFVVQTAQNLPARF